MTTKDLRAFLSKQMGMSKNEVDKAVSGFVMAIVEGLQKDGYVRVHGLGIFKVKMMKAHKGYNPQTKEVMDVPERPVVRFKLAENTPQLKVTV